MPHTRRNSGGQSRDDSMSHLCRPIETRVISITYIEVHSLDTVGGRHYVARDFEGLHFNFRPGGAGDSGMAQSRNTKRPPSGEKPGALTSDLAARIKRAQAEESLAGDAEVASA